MPPRYHATRVAIAPRVAIVIVLLLSPASAASAATAGDGDDGWTLLSADDGFSAWRDDHRGWATGGDAALAEESRSRLVAVDGSGVMVSPEGHAANLVTRADYQDIELECEFLIARRSNSGVKLNGLYEVQIRDTAGEKPTTGDMCGGVYPRAEQKPSYHLLDRGVPPRVNAALPAGKWQTLAIQFRSPRFDDQGNRIRKATFVEVRLNGKLVQENVELDYPTGGAWRLEKETPRGPIYLQGDHGPVAFRKLRVRELTAAPSADPK